MSRKTIDFYEYMPTTPEGFARVWWRDGVLNFEDVLLPKSGAFELYTIEQMRDYAMHAVKRALEQQPVGETVAEVVGWDDEIKQPLINWRRGSWPPANGNLYTRPQPAAHLIGLPPQEIHAIWAAVKPDWDVPRGAVSAIYEHIEAKLRETKIFPQSTEPSAGFSCPKGPSI